MNSNDFRAARLKSLCCDDDVATMSFVGRGFSRAAKRCDHAALAAEVLNESRLT